MTVQYEKLLIIQCDSTVYRNHECLDISELAIYIYQPHNAIAVSVKHSQAQKCLQCALKCFQQITIQKFLFSGISADLLSY